MLSNKPAISNKFPTVQLPIAPTFAHVQAPILHRPLSKFPTTAILVSNNSFPVINSPRA